MNLPTYDLTPEPAPSPRAVLYFIHSADEPLGPPAPNTPQPKTLDELVWNTGPEIAD